MSAQLCVENVRVKCLLRLTKLTLEPASEMIPVLIRITMVCSFLVTGAPTDKSKRDTEVCLGQAVYEIKVAKICCQRIFN